MDCSRARRCRHGVADRGSEEIRRLVVDALLAAKPHPSHIQGDLGCFISERAPVGILLVKVDAEILAT